MNEAPRTPSRDATSGVPHGSPEKLREVLAETLWFIGLSCEIGIRHVEIGDDAGLSYSVRRLAASMRVVVATTADLLERFPQSEGRIERKWTTEETRS